MKINLHILADELRIYDPEIYCDNSLDLDLSRFEMHRRQTDIDTGCLYIIEAKELLPELLCIKNAHWLCCGELSGSLLNCCCGNILVLPSERCIIGIEDEISRIFEKYNMWSDQLLTLCMSNDGIRQAFKTNLLEDMFENPILMQNGVGLYAISCGALPNDFDSARWAEIAKFDNKRRGEYSLADVYGESGGSLRRPFISEVTQNYQLLSTNAFNGGLLVGRLTHCNARRPFTNGYLSMANYLNSIFEVIIARNIQDDLVGGGDSSVFIELLGSWHTNSEWLDGHLRGIGWNRGEAAYLVVVSIRHNRSGMDPLLLQLIASRVEKVFAGEFVFEYRRNVVAVVRDGNYAYDARLIKEKLENAVHGHDVVCMVSLLFYDISKIREYYEQCLFLIERESGNSEEIVRFYEDDFFQHFLLHYGIESGYEWLINPKVALLRAYDENTGSDLVLCLKTIIECCGDKKAAAEQLGIHYNTLLYRIARMKEIAGIDISHMMGAFGSELFHVLLSAKLLTDAKL